MKMKFFTVFAALLMVFAYSSCTSGSKSKKTGYASPEMEFRNSLTAEDTVNMLKLADDCMELLQSREKRHHNGLQMACALLCVQYVSIYGDLVFHWISQPDGR